MIYIDWRKARADNMLEVTVLCSKCKKTHPVLIDRISKLSMSICPYCNNVDVERTAGKIPTTVEKQLNELLAKNLIYTIDGIGADEFLTGLAMSDLGFEGFEDYRETSQTKSYSGLYRLKSYYGQAKAKKQMNLTDFPTFEEFMLWSVKQGYRDWKTLKLDESNTVNKNAKWVAGGYNKKNADKTLQITTELMSTLSGTKATLIGLEQQLKATIGPLSLDQGLLNATIITLIQQINTAEAEIMKKL